MGLQRQWNPLKVKYVLAIGPKYFWLIPALLMRISNPFAPTTAATSFAAAYMCQRDLQEGESTATDCSSTTSISTG